MSSFRLGSGTRRRHDATVSMYLSLCHCLIFALGSLNCKALTSGSWVKIDGKCSTSCCVKLASRRCELASLNSKFIFRTSFAQCSFFEIFSSRFIGEILFRPLVGLDSASKCRNNHLAALLSNTLFVSRRAARSSRASDLVKPSSHWGFDSPYADSWWPCSQRKKQICW